MFTSRKKRAVEQWFDRQEGAEREESACGFSGDAELAGHLADIRRLREGVKAVAVRQQIADDQFGAFMAGIHERLTEQAPRRAPGMWALASMAAVVLLVAISAVVVMMGKPAGVRAEQTEIEAYSTEIKGATVDAQSDKDTATVWVNVPAGDVW
ncbi:MAG TPA: hypothetical protein PLO62_09980 [Candidatus Hydrogenedentes bacterium]|nr:hypothetical protein [Candidatus Hydrogenedentota bacterium]HOS02341.1 hypothetical protein [Candidatus Hydrogenedentota bacterium]